MMIKHDMNYMGPSMNPTLQAGDGLNIVPYRNEKIRIGDVIVFSHPEEENNIVHRVVSVNSQGVKTRGDNNIRIDPWILQLENIIGSVVSAQRKNSKVTIHGGEWGRILAPMLWAIKQINIAVSRILHPVYHWLAKSGIFIKYSRFLPQTRILLFNRPEGKEFHLLLGSRVIGRRPSGKDKWHIQRPFRLFIDESSLP